MSVLLLYFVGILSIHVHSNIPMQNNMVIYTLYMLVVPHYFYDNSLMGHSRCSKHSFKLEYCGL